ncbi:hypothetical protein GN244_ATG09100 [Phytophthora infestans]|uniref:Uncharacterized protein n=1 Tax=Phytophthora infestans TaxID=4787 RepID=A0A833WK19_PHYIN|nr:hypothetical protein GN244_ATG09100 [Phytophthora infestans]
MESNAELLTDAAFFLETANFLEMHSLVSTDNVEPSGTLVMPEQRGAPSLGKARGREISGEAAINTLKLYREKEKFRRRKQRQRIKDETEGLRRRSDELSLQLKNLKFGKEVKRTASSRQFSIWKEVASIQREERLKSEAEQRRLTTTANTQAAYIDNLRGLFHLRQKPASWMSGTEHTENSDTGHSERIDTIEPRLGMSDVPLFTSLLQKIDACYARFDDVVNRSGLTAMPVGEVNSTQWRNDSGELEYHQKLQNCINEIDTNSTDLDLIIPR